MKVKIEELKQLETLLRSACHAPGCNRLNICPRQCRCKFRRSFKLNTETAACWQMAENINLLIRHKNPAKAHCMEVIHKVRAYCEIARFHMSKGWKRFFQHVELCIINLTIDSDSITWTYLFGGQGEIDCLTKMLPRLKRYPKVETR